MYPANSMSFLDLFLNTLSFLETHHRLSWNIHPCYAELCPSLGRLWSGLVLILCILKLSIQNYCWASRYIVMLV